MQQLVMDVRWFLAKDLWNWKGKVDKGSKKICDDWQRINDRFAKICETKKEWSMKEVEGYMTIGDEGSTELKR